MKLGKEEEEKKGGRNQRAWALTKRGKKKTKVNFGRE